MHPQPFSLSFSQSLSEKPFCEGQANAQAISWITRWPDWPKRGLYLYGPPACGKTHLASQWAKPSGALVLHGPEVHDAFLASLSHRPDNAFVLEDVHQVPRDVDLLHLLNLWAEKKSFFLLTSRVPAHQLPFRLPDLTSRLRALTSVAMLDPDDALLQKTLSAHFFARGLHVGPEVLAYLYPRMNRSFQAVCDVVDRLDQASLSYQKEISIPFVRKTLGYAPTGDAMGAGEGRGENDPLFHSANP
jgi:chromosomal replication initiation ATPase DnaA